MLSPKKYCENAINLTTDDSSLDDTIYIKHNVTPRSKTLELGCIELLKEAFAINVIDLSCTNQKTLNKTNDEVRMNFLKTLKSKKILSDKPSVKEQTSKYSYRKFIQFHFKI